MSSIAKRVLAIGSSVVVAGTAASVAAGGDPQPVSYSGSPMAAYAATNNDYYTPIIPPFITVSGKTVTINKEYDKVNNGASDFFKDFYDGNYLIAIQQQTATDYIQHGTMDIHDPSTYEYVGSDKRWTLIFMKLAFPQPTTSFYFTYSPKTTPPNGSIDPSFSIANPMCVYMPQDSKSGITTFAYVYDYKTETLKRGSSWSSMPNAYNHIDFTYVLNGKIDGHSYQVNDGSGGSGQATPHYPWWLGDTIIDKPDPPVDPGESSESSASSNIPDPSVPEESDLEFHPFDPSDYEPLPPPDSTPFDPLSSLPKPEPPVFPSKPESSSGGTPSRPESSGGGTPSRPESSGGGTPSRPASSGGGTPSRPESSGGGTPSRPESSGGGKPSRPESSGGGTPSRPESSGGGKPSRPEISGGGKPSRPESSGGGKPSRPESSGSGIPSRPASSGGGTPSRPASSGGGVPSRP